MKVLFYLLDGESNASSRHRVLQYFPYLRQHGIEPLASRPVPETVYQRLMEHGDGSTWSKAAFYGLFLVCRLIDVLRSNRAEVVVIQRDLFPFGPPVLERLLARRNTRLVYDTDDATYLRPAFTPNTPFQRLRRLDKVAEVVSSARWVSAATEPIAAWVGQYNKHVTVVPMAVDLAEYAGARGHPASAEHAGLGGHALDEGHAASGQSPQVGGHAASGQSPQVRGHAASGERMVLGWAGTAGGLRYLEALAPVLRDLADRRSIVVRVISGGYRDVCLPGVPVEARPWRAATALEDMRAFDIGLVPLDDTPFERAKFPFKLLQYLALGVPTVSARVGVARDVLEHGRNGLLAGSPDEWRAALEYLIADAALRQRVAAAGRDTVAAHYTIERVAPLLVEVLSSAAR